MKVLLFIFAALLLIPGCGTVYEGSVEQHASDVAVQVAKDSAEEDKPKALPPLYTSGVGFAFQFGGQSEMGFAGGLRAGYSTGNQLYFGVAYSEYINFSQSTSTSVRVHQLQSEYINFSNLFGLGSVISIVPTNLGVEIGYEVPASTIIVRPYLQSGLFRINKSSDILGVKQTSREDFFYLAPCVLIQLPLRGGPVSFHLDNKFIIVPNRTASVANSYGFHFGMGFKF